VIIISGIAIAVCGINWWHTTTVGHFFNRCICGAWNSGGTSCSCPWGGHHRGLARHPGPPALGGTPHRHPSGFHQCVDVGPSECVAPPRYRKQFHQWTTRVSMITPTW
jgi:hypothetical protein